MENKEPNKEITKEELCNKIQEIYQYSCIEKHNNSVGGFFNPAIAEMGKIVVDLKNFSCLNAINSIFKQCKSEIN